MSVKFVRIDEEYTNYLHYQCDERVQLKSARPHVGVLLNINGMSYFAPLEMPKPNHTTIKASIYLEKMNGGLSGLIGLNNMIPVPKEVMKPINFRTVPNREAYLNQYQYCVRNQAALQRKAEKLYTLRCTATGKIVETVCDFEKLEAGMIKYCQSKDYSLPPMLAYKSMQGDSIFRTYHCSNVELIANIKAQTNSVAVTKNDEVLIAISKSDEAIVKSLETKFLIKNPAKPIKK